MANIDNVKLDRLSVAFVPGGIQLSLQGFVPLQAWPDPDVEDWCQSAAGPATTKPATRRGAHSNAQSGVQDDQRSAINADVLDALDAHAVMRT
jgi:hypothetical protein